MEKTGKVKTKTKDKKEEKSESLGKRPIFDTGISFKPPFLQNSRKIPVSKISKKTHKIFDIEKSYYKDNPVFLSKLLDPYTARLAQYAYNLGLTGDMVTLISFVVGMSGIAIMAYYQTYLSLVIAAILITLKNIGDTMDGKITRGSGIKSTYGGFTDIILDWLIFLPALYLSLGYITGYYYIAFFCIIGYMSREFARRKFQIKYGNKITETEESQKITGIKSIVTKYDQANALWIAPLFLLINQPLLFIYLIAFIEYLLLIGELGFDYYCFFQKQKKMKWDAGKKEWIPKL
ncbi:CDP-alcohol phosphatidyltransferase family protein [Candidatus Pacearchaeota archaeon]|nr:CDP-alcohol phosphatidyltransferase family protein [Candidatus Pacearchaeota archaeon]